MLDAGCGSEMKFTHEMEAHASCAVGIDIEDLQIRSPKVLGVRGDLNALPFKDETFDMIISMSVIEHLLDPEHTFLEFSRVLKPGGFIILQTPNKYDYVSVASRLTPFRFHQWLLPKIQDRKPEEAFPTFYRANTKRKLNDLLNQGELILRKLEFFNQYPAYLMFSPFVFRMGILYERLTSRFEVLSQLRGWILAIAQKTI
jgi:SAM-dependent methyltransferase